MPQPDVEHRVARTDSGAFKQPVVESGHGRVVLVGVTCPVVALRTVPGAQLFGVGLVHPQVGRVAHLDVLVRSISSHWD